MAYEDDDYCSAVVSYTQNSLFDTLHTLYYYQLFYSFFSVLFIMQEIPLELHEGDLAPDFVMKDAQGNTSRLSDLKGKKDIVVYFYPEDFTPGCSTQAAEFSRDYDKFKDAGIEIVGVSPNNEESHHKFRQKMGIPYPLVADTDKEVSENYGVYGLKKFMGREYMGVNRSTFIIDRTGIIIKIFRKVRPAGHSQEVFQTLRGHT
jgi:peroxiredoxin Q/BCP